MILTATPLYAGLLALLFVALSARVIVQRRRAHVSVGDGNDQSLRQKMRVHANFAEYTPIGLVLLGLTELQGAHDLVRLPIKKLSNRAAAGAFHALIAEIDVLPQLLTDLFCQAAVDSDDWLVCEFGFL